jgi:hypothetical protein
MAPILAPSWTAIASPVRPDRRDSDALVAPAVPVDLVVQDVPAARDESAYRQDGSTSISSSHAWGLHRSTAAVQQVHNCVIRPRERCYQTRFHRPTDPIDRVEYSEVIDAERAQKRRGG